MANHRKYDLLEQIVQSVNQCGWEVIYEESTTIHPFVLRVFRGDESYRLRIYIWNLTHGGGSARAADEFRVQITGVDRFVQNAGERTLILGWWPVVGVFAGFDFNFHNEALGWSSSIQIREENLRHAAINGFSPCNKGNNEIAIAFRPDFFIDYVRNLRELHAIGENAAAVEIVEQVAQGVAINDADLAGVVPERRVVIETVTKRLRENDFKQRILSAYQNKCAFSGMQLKLVDAAHILPVSDPLSTDATSNGIALSALYHRAFDRGLITLNSEYQIIINDEKLEKLTASDLGGGIDTFIDTVRPMIFVPAAVNDRPNINFINQANILRGWNFD